MNLPLNSPRHPWARLASAARTVRDDRATAAPFGFATRVAALALGQEPGMVSLFDVFAVRALWVAGLLAVFSVAMNYGELASRLGGAGPGADDSLLGANDAVAVVLALAD